MKLIHILSLMFVVIGGLHFALIGVGFDLIGTIFGAGQHITMMMIVIGLSTLYHIIPMLQSQIKSL